MRNFPYTKIRKPRAERAALTLRHLADQSQHKLVLKDARWQCEHCHFRVGTTGLRQLLRRHPQCVNPLDYLGEHRWGVETDRMDRPLRMKAMCALTLQGRTSHLTHSLLFYRGLYLCIRCGLVAHREVSNELMQECTGRPTSYYRKFNLRNFSKEPPKPPINFKEFPSPEQSSAPINLHIARLTRRARIEIRNRHQHVGTQGDVVHESESD